MMVLYSSLLFLIHYINSIYSIGGWNLPERTFGHLKSPGLPDGWKGLFSPQMNRRYPFLFIMCREDEHIMSRNRSLRAFSVFPGAFRSHGAGAEGENQCQAWGRVTPFCNSGEKNPLIIPFQPSTQLQPCKTPTPLYFSTPPRLIHRLRKVIHRI